MARPVPHIPSLVCPVTGSIWIFGYGSLVWRPGFEHARRVEGYIKGYRRVWWQGSTDHRGTPEAPGRTVTLEKREGAITWGVAWELAGDLAQQERTLLYLEEREKQYDQRVILDVWGRPDQLGVFQEPSTTLNVDESSSTDDSTDPVQGPACETSQLLLPHTLCYIASSDTTRNTNYLGPASHEELVQQIARSKGPSGPNSEYLLKLSAAMKQMGVYDEELFNLERDVLKALQQISHRNGHVPSRSPGRTKHAS